MNKKENNQFLYEWQDANLVLPPLNQECVLQFKGQIGDIRFGKVKGKKYSY